MDEKSIIERLKKTEFQQVVSLGFFCSVAHDLEELGLRSCSGPLDWVWSTWNGVYGAMRNEFADFFGKENLWQAAQDSCVYADRKYDIVSFHDFSRYKSFDSQYSAVKDKYDRRIGNFYERIKSPTLFIRYIWNGEYKGKPSNEIKQIEKDYVEFLKLIKSYHEENEVVFIANNDIYSEILPLFLVQKDKGDDVNRHPIFGNDYLRTYLEEMKFAAREKNLEIYRKKVQREKGFLRRASRKIILFFSKCLLREYKYEKQYNHGEYKC